jgi:AcrR family transcriptional regulator
MPPGTRDQLIEMAARLLDEGGVEAVTLREVGRLAGVSHNAPYKHFANKEALLAAIAARELARRRTALAATVEQGRSADEVLRTTLHGYVAWALDRPARFKLTFGTWSVDSEELRVAAHEAQTMLIDIVAAAQKAGALPAGDPVRLASLVRALAHGAADLASAGHLARDGKGHAGPDDLVDDLLRYLRAAATTWHDRSPA